ncbi:MAG: hypothetical protein SOZ80_02805 [Prevotella sp.]|uniref:hypothetical protein n=1 Tax=Prevotella sp. TaxID=59823 RepID=UPI002A2D3B4A|nr:hypothetical protein [Prevotella sp.]MDD7318301.1 hypothetical protein [Prevotellaceae bacterium]MDY4019695.1 hypothetical protein [Prevotella sp.]
MKRYVIISIILLALSITVNAQNRHGRSDFDPAKLKAEMEQFITKEACLTPIEASIFFPVFDEMMRSERALFDQIKTLQQVKPATEQGCADAVRKRDMLEIQIKELQQQYHNRFLKILPASKVYDALRAKHRFHRRMFKQGVCRMGK